MINNTLLFVTKLAVGTLLVFWLLFAFTASANTNGYIKDWHKLGSVVFNPGAGVQRHHKGHVHTPFCGHDFDK